MDIIYSIDAMENGEVKVIFKLGGTERMRNYSYRTLDIAELYVNPGNYRYVEEVQDEISAIIAMFKVNVGDSRKEMINLANDIIEDGLNPFEMPIVCYDDEVGKYIVYDGNRRITCLKLMTQYKGNAEVLKEFPSVAEIYKLQYNGDNSIQCVVYDDADDAIHFLNKIHNDINNGIGRKQWDSQAKMKANAAYGNKTKSYAIVEFLKNNPNTSTELLEKMKTNRWISKLERVVSFSLFKDVYNIQFDNNSNISYLDTEEQVLRMLSRLVDDIITNTATGNFRFKSDFQGYVDSLPNEYKTQIKNKKDNKHENSFNGENRNSEDTISKRTGNNNGLGADPNDNKNGTAKNSQKKEENDTGVGRPKNIPHKHAETKEALVLCKNYDYSEYMCLNEKGKEMLVELENLNIKDYPVATVALCRCLLEYTLKLWLDEQGGNFDSGKLPTCYNGCVNLLRSKNIIDNKEHSVLNTLVNKENYITLLNTWMHADTDACVSETPLVSGWKNARLLIEKYIETHKK